jgi:hypothetical protein
LPKGEISRKSEKKCLQYNILKMIDFVDIYMYREISRCRKTFDP